MPYQPTLPEGHAAAGLKIDTSHPDYRQLEALATEEGWSQKSFSRVLGLEASRVMAQAPKPAAPAAPAAPARAALPENFKSLSSKERFAIALTRSPTRSRL
jgi:hypothetical protein